MGIFDNLLSRKSSIKSPVIVFCPNCGSQLVKAPMSKTKCMICMKDIYVRTHYQTKEKLYLSERQKNELDEDRKAYFFEKEWRKQLSNLGILEKEMKEANEVLTKRWGKSPSFNDLVWYLFNHQVIKLGKDSSYYDLKILYWTWSLFAYNINRDPFELLKQAHKFELLGYKASGVIDKVEVLANQGCGNCMKLNGKIYEINALLKENDILPNKQCTHELSKEIKYSWCRCMFIAVTPLSSLTTRG